MGRVRQTGINQLLAATAFMASAAIVTPANAADGPTPFKVTFDGAYSTYESGSRPNQIKVVVAEPLRFYASDNTYEMLNDGSLDISMEGYGILVKPDSGSFNIESLDLRTLDANHPNVNLYFYDYSRIPTFPLSFTPPPPDQLVSLSLAT